MRNFCVFFKKEWIESIRGKKFYVLTAVFVFFAILGAVSAKYMSEILEWAMSMSTDSDTTIFNIPETTWVDAWGQFYGNISQIGVLCVVFMYMGSVSSEKRSGSAALTLTKNLSHTTFIMAKFVVALLITTISFVIGVIVCYGYTYYFYGHAGDVFNILAGAFSFVVFMFLMISIIMLSSTIAKSTVGSVGFAFLAFMIISILNIVRRIEHLWPGSLLTKSPLFSAGVSLNGFIGAFIVTILSSLLCLLLSIKILKKQEI